MEPVKRIPIDWVNVREFLEQYGIKTAASITTKDWLQSGWIKDEDVYSRLSVRQKKGSGGHNKKDYFISPEAHAKVLTHIRPAAKDLEAYVVDTARAASEGNLNGRVDRLNGRVDRLEQMMEIQIEQSKTMTMILDKIVTRVEHMQQPQIAAPEKYFTVSEYADEVGAPTSLEERQILGSLATRMCIDRRIFIRKTGTTRVGQINRYPLHIVEEVFNNYYRVV